MICIVERLHIYTGTIVYHYFSVPNSQAHLTIYAMKNKCWVFFYLLQ